jgi:hypothetical protein
LSTHRLIAIAGSLALVWISGSERAVGSGDSQKRSWLGQRS